MLGAVLSQNFNGGDLPIYFASKLFNKAQQKKPTIEQELLAIYYVYGTTFTVRPDHRPLVYLFNMKDPSSKLTKIRLELSEYNFTIEYIRGKNNVAADALSRISFDELKNANKDVFVITTRAMTRQLEPENKGVIAIIEELPIYDKVMSLILKYRRSDLKFCIQITN